MATGIYVIRQIGTSRVYVGSSTSIEKRFVQHRRDLWRKRHTSKFLQNAYNKRGLGAFAFEIIEQCSLELLKTREQFYLDTMNSCFNISKLAAGGSRKEDWNSQRKANLAKSALGNQKTKGLVWSAKARANMSNATKGKPRSPAQRAATLRSLELAREKARVNKPGMNWRLLRRKESKEQCELPF